VLEHIENFSGNSSVLATATAEGRSLVTFDLDFGDIRRYPLGTHAGIVVFRLCDQRWKPLAGPVGRLLAHGLLHQLGKALAMADESWVRIRRPK